jgi:MFS superfamily sulfate permease-like transporter
MTATALSDAFSNARPEDYLIGAEVLALSSGMMLLAFGILRLVFLGYSLSFPIITGFISGSAIICRLCAVSVAKAYIYSLSASVQGAPRVRAAPQITLAIFSRHNKLPPLLHISPLACSAFSAIRCAESYCRSRPSAPPSPKSTCCLNTRLNDSDYVGIGFGALLNPLRLRSSSLSSTHTLLRSS